MKLRVATAFLLVAMLGGWTPARASVEPGQVASTAGKLHQRRLDTSRSFPADGQIVERHGLIASFDSGRFLPLVRDDGRLVGLVFDGQGFVEARLPGEEEVSSWQRGTRNSPVRQGFDGAVLLATDGTLSDLQGERAWGEGGDPTGGAFRMWEARRAMLDEGRWTQRRPYFAADQALDLYGGGSDGGFLWAEFRMGPTSPWLSYHHNPRGGLLLDDVTTWLTLRPRDDAPPEMNVLASWGAPEVARRFDVRSTRLDVSFLVPRPTVRSLSDARIVAQLDVVALGAPLRALALEFEPERCLCREQSDRGDFELLHARDGAGRPLGVVRDSGRLVVVLAEPVAVGDMTTVEIAYEGAVTQGVPYAVGGTVTPDTMFSELGPWAWYPRNPHPDRFGSRVAVHLPRYMRAVTVGSLVESREERDGWHYTFEEPSGVRRISLSAGDFVMTKEEDRGAGPAVIHWYARPEEKRLLDKDGSARRVLSVLAQAWGPYPYSTLHVVQNQAFPAVAWQMGSGSSGSWGCAPPGSTQPFDAFVDTGSGVVFQGLPTTVPATDVREAAAYDRLFVDSNDASSFRFAMDLARQWWGHLGPPATYRDLWLTEALAAASAYSIVHGASGRPALLERLQTARLLARDGAVDSPAPGLGGRLGRSFPFQVWGRGSLLIQRLFARADGRAMLGALRLLLDRGAGAGIREDAFLEAVRSVSEGAAARIASDAHRTDLVDLRYDWHLEQDEREIVVVLSTGSEEGGGEVSVEIDLGGKERIHRSVEFAGGWTEWRLVVDKPIKKVEFDPLGSSLVASLKREKGLRPTAEAP